MAAVLEIVVDVYAVARAIIGADAVALPGALGRTGLMAALAGLAIFKRSRVSRWVFAGAQYATAGGGLAFAFFTFPEGRLTFQPSAFAIFAGYLLLAVLASIGQVQHAGGPAGAASAVVGPAPDGPSTAKPSSRAAAELEARIPGRRET